MKKADSKLRFFIMLVISIGFFALFSEKLYAQEVLYENSFNTPATGITITQGEDYYDLDDTQVQELFAGTGTTKIGSVYFDNTYTVETIMNRGNGSNPEVYAHNDHTIGGNYSMGMQSGRDLSTGGQGENDRVAIKLMAGSTWDYINVSLDISLISLRNIGNPPAGNQFTNPGLPAPRFIVKAYSAPNWTAGSQVFVDNDVPSSVGTLIGQPIVLNGVKSSDVYTYNWKSVGFSIDLRTLTGNPDRKIIITLDLDETVEGLQYAAFDNLLITADDTSLPVTFGSINAVIKNNNLSVNWQTETETNNSHFDVMVSTDGANFKKIGTVNSRALNGNSSAWIKYEFSTPLGAATGLMGLSFALLGLFVTGKNRRIAALLLIVVIGSVAISCSKTDSEVRVEANKKIFVKVVQVDSDGTSASSSVVQAIYE